MKSNPLRTNDPASAKSAEDKPRVRRMGSIINQLMSRRGYAQLAANEQLQQVIASVVGDPLQSSFEVGQLRRGVLQIFASDSVTLQELNFQKRAILKRIQQQTPEHAVKDVRFRIQS